MPGDIQLDAIIFDFDDTLVADQDAAKRAFHQTARIAADRYDVNAEQLARMAREEARRIWRTFTPVRSYYVSGDVGEGKPAPRIFETTLDQLGVPAATTAMVGDSIERDVAGAQVLGMIGVWVNRDRARNTTEIRPDRTIFSLAEL